MAILSLVPITMMLFVPPTIVSWILISSLVFHFLYTGILIYPNFIPPVPKLWQFFLTVSLFLGSMIALIMIFTLLRIIQERKETQHQFRILTLEETFSSPFDLDLLFGFLPLEDPFNCLDLYIDCVFTSPDSSSSSISPTPD